MGGKRKASYTAFLCAQSRSMPDEESNHTHHHQAAQRAGQDELTAQALTAADKLIIMMIAVTLSVDIPHQAYLLIGLAVRGEKAAPINILIEQRIATTKYHEQRA